MSPVNFLKKNDNQPTVKLERKLWLTADKETVVEDGDPAAAFLLGLPGDEISATDAARLGIKERKVRPAKEVEPNDDKEATPAGDKEAKPDGNKSRAGASKATAARAKKAATKRAGRARSAAKKPAAPPSEGGDA